MVKKLSQYKRDVFNPYVINLDPACKEVPYPANIDIRDTINYKQVMKNYNLGKLNVYCKKKIYLEFNF